MRHKTPRDSSAKPERGSLELTEQLIRVRAYQLYEERGRRDGHDIEDWLRAEAEILAKKPAAAEAEDTAGGSMTPAA